MSVPLGTNQLQVSQVYVGVGIQANNNSFNINAITGEIDCQSLYIQGVNILDLINYKPPSNGIQQFLTSPYYITGPIDQFLAVNPAPAIQQFGP
jgi:hypothetical protein